MSILEPRLYLKGLLSSGVVVTKDNGVTAASVVVFYSEGPEPFRRLFEVNNYDVVIAVERGREREAGPEKRQQSVPIRYESEIPVKVYAIDKSGVTAVKILNKVRLSMISTIEAAAEGTRTTIVLQEDRSANATVGGYTPLFCDAYTVSFRPLKEIG